MCLKVLTFCCLIFQSLAGGPSFSDSSSSSEALPTGPVCMTCKYVLTQINNFDDISDENCILSESIPGIKTGIRITFIDAGMAPAYGYCINTNENVDLNEGNPLIDSYSFY